MRANVSRFHARQNAIAFRNTAALREPAMSQRRSRGEGVHWTTEIELAKSMTLDYDSKYCTMIWIYPTDVGRLPRPRQRQPAPTPDQDITYEDVKEYAQTTLVFSPGSQIWNVAASDCVSSPAPARNRGPLGLVGTHLAGCSVNGLPAVVGDEGPRWIFKLPNAKCLQT
jgi:hypothetical protein